MLLNIDKISKKYGDLTAVDNLSMHVDQGQIYGLLGPNGSGKSTLIKTIIGMLKPDGGTTLLFDKIQPGELFARKNIGYMPQNPSVYNGLTVWENIYFFGKLYGLDDLQIQKKGNELLSVLDLQSKLNELAIHLSGGMVRRLSLACCLIHSPKLILLDEPTAGVDPVLRLQFWDYFTQLAFEGAGIIITTHHISEASRCNRVGFMRTGKIFIEDTPEGLMKTFQADNLEQAFVNSTKIKATGDH